MNLTSGSGKLALVAAAVLVLALGGCGRKSRLSPPPQAAVEQPAPAQQGSADAPAATPRSNPLGLFEPEEEDRPTAAQGQKRRIILDRILD